jgi:glycine reductase
MKLELGEIHIQRFSFAEVSSLKGGHLQLSKSELEQYIRSLHPQITEVETAIVNPGDSVRIMPVKDVIEPRCKLDGGCCFPGFNPGEEEIVGSGKTLALKGIAVVTTGKVVGFQEGIIDMSGPGADYSPYSALRNLVLRIEVDEHCNQYQHEEVLRRVGLMTARWVADQVKTTPAESVAHFETLPLAEQLAQHPDLPSVGYVYMLQSQGLLHDSWYYGIDVKKMVPTLMFPTEAMDGAIVSGNCVSACDKNTTWSHQNNPVIQALYRRHGKDLNFIGVILTNENVTLSDKVRSSNMVAKLAEQMQLDGAIITEEGFGNPDADLMMNCCKLEAKGIRTVLLTDEYAGRGGESQSLADAHPAADAVVTAGNANALITLPPMQRVIGHPVYADMIAGGFDGSLHEDGSITVELQAITGATSELGVHTLSAHSG